MTTVLRDRWGKYLGRIAGHWQAHFVPPTIDPRTQVGPTHPATVPDRPAGEPGLRPLPAWLYVVGDAT